MSEVVMPRLSDSMEEGVILRWLKSVGDEVAVGDELVEIETDKANMVYESDVAGTLSEIVVGEDESAAVGAVIARVGGEVDAEPAAPPATSSEPTPATPRAQPSAPAPTSPSPVAALRVKASPLARRIAREAGVDLAGITGTGPGGRIVKADVVALAEQASAPASASGAPLPAQAPPAPSASPRNGATAKGTAEIHEITKLQATVARRMAESKATVPEFYLEAEIDMSRCMEARAEFKRLAGDGDVVPSLNDMVVKACALALRDFPLANGAYRDGKFELYSRINIGVAVAAPDALVVPTVFDCDRKGLREIATETRALAARVREGTITPPELAGGTFTVSNLGMYGVTNFHAVINPPQAGILALGAVTEKPVVKDGEVTTAHLMQATLTCDHRILYGADGAALLGRIRTLLEAPVSLAA